MAKGQKRSNREAKKTETAEIRKSRRGGRDAPNGSNTDLRWLSARCTE